MSIEEIFQAIFENPSRIIVFIIVFLIVPGALFFYLLIGGELLKATGHETSGSIITGLVTGFGNITTKIGKALLIPGIYLFIFISIGIAIYNSIKK